MPSALERMRRAAARDGMSGLLKASSRHAAARLWTREEHVWYELPLSSDLVPGPDLAPLELVRAGPAQLELVEQLGRTPLTPAEFGRRDQDLWLVLDNRRPVFACWIHRDEAPMVAAPGRWLPLPESVVCLEDSVTAEDQRGRGTAPRAWAAIAASLVEDGVYSIITKVATDNEPSRRAVQKAGFNEIAVMRYRRRGSREHVSVDVLDGSGTAEVLRQRLERR